MNGTEPSFELPNISMLTSGSCEISKAKLLARRSASVRETNL
jgi:hypothetical protein